MPMYMPMYMRMHMRMLHVPTHVHYGQATHRGATAAAAVKDGPRNMRVSGGVKKDARVAQHTSIVFEATHSGNERGGGADRADGVARMRADRVIEALSK